MQETHDRRVERYAGRFGRLARLGTLLGVSRSTGLRLKSPLKAVRREGDRAWYVPVTVVYEQFGPEVAELFDAHAHPLVADREGARRARNQALLLLRQARGRMDANRDHVCAGEDGDHSTGSGPEAA